MSATPEITQRAEQPYVGVRAQVSMQELGGLAQRLPEVFGWLAARGIPPAGAPFFRYNLIDMTRELEVEAGVPVTAPAAADHQVISGVLPAGRYATVIHVGEPAGLAGATGELLSWAAEHGMSFDVTQTRDGERWGARLEMYLTDPAQEPNMSKWETQLAFRLAD